MPAGAAAHPRQRQKEVPYEQGISNEAALLIERDSKLSEAELAQMLACDTASVHAALTELENDQVICGYHTLINWDKVDPDSVTALVELRVTPQGGDGYNKIAEVIYQYPEVESLYLMSGAYDFLVMPREKNLKAISMFVSENWPRWTKYRALQPILR